jgi:hypothetical protein
MCKLTLSALLEFSPLALAADLPQVKFALCAHVSDTNPTESVADP